MAFKLVIEAPNLENIQAAVQSLVDEFVLETLLLARAEDKVQWAQGDGGGLGGQPWAWRLDELHGNNDQLMEE